MSFPDYKYGTGLGNVGSYQVSGKPYASSSAVPASGAGVPAASHKFVFPTVTKEITVINNGASGKPVRVAFSTNGLEDHVKNYILVHPAVDGVANTTINVKATELYVMSNDGATTTTVSVYAALTGISVDRINNITPSGSNWAGTAGVG